MTCQDIGKVEVRGKGELVKLYELLVLNQPLIPRVASGGDLTHYFYLTLRIEV